MTRVGELCLLACCCCCCCCVQQIANSSHSGKLSIKNQRPKYQITHPSGKIAEAADVKLRLNYNVQPWVGVLTWNQYNDVGHWKSVEGGVSKAFTLPAVRKKDEEKKKSS